VDSLIEGFRKTESGTLKKYPQEIQKILIQTKLIPVFDQPIVKYARSDLKFSRRYYSSLTRGCEYELIRTSAYTLFLTTNALYKSAEEKIRYMLESILQSTYIDTNHLIRIFLRNGNTERGGKQEGISFSKFDNIMESSGS
jgi:hypothetical protein